MVQLCSWDTCNNFTSFFSSSLGCPWPSLARGSAMHRERIVSGSASGKALSRSSKESLGGSSNVLRNAFAACGCSLSASEMIATLRRELLARICSACSRRRICSITIRRDFDSGRATKISRALAEKTSPTGVPFTRLASFAASCCLPLPGGPEIKYAWASLSCSWARRKHSSAAVREKAISDFRCLMFDVRCFAQRGKARQNDLPNLVLDYVRVARAVDQHHAIWFARGQVSISPTNSLIEFGELLFHPIGPPRFLHS